MNLGAIGQLIPPLPFRLSQSPAGGGGGGLSLFAFVTASTVTQQLLTCSFSNLPPNTLLVYAWASELGNRDQIIASVPALTWTKQADDQTQTGNSGDAEIHTAIFTAGGSISAATTMDTSELRQDVVCYAIISGSIGLSGSAVNQPTASVFVTPQSASAFIICVSSDWNAIDGAARTYKDVPIVETRYNFVNGIYTAYHYYKVVTGSAVHNVGYTAPLGCSVGSAVLIVEGV